MLVLETNKYLTPITEELLALYPEEVAEQFKDCIYNIEFIKNLISPRRRYAKDMPKDELGRIIVDLENPHIIEDADYFRLPALHFMKHGCYTFLKPNSNPHSEYRKFWDEELRRCYEGYVRKSDGEWVTGYMYWFMNYNPMMVNLIKEGSKRADRVESFPFFFEGIYWRFHYIQKAREEGQHAIELAKRGAHPYFERVYTSNGIKSWGEIKIGDKLYGTYGNITTVTDIPFNGIADTYKLTFKDGREVYASDDHIWLVGVSSKRRTNAVTTKQMFTDPNFRLKSGLFKYAVPINQGANFKFQSVPIDPYTLGFLLGDGCFKRNPIQFAQSPKDYIEIKKYIPYETKLASSNGIHYNIYIENGINILKELGLFKTDSYTKFIPSCYKYNSKEVRLEVLRGLMDSDGWCSKNRSPQICTISPFLKEDIIEVSRSLGYTVKCIKKKSGYKDKTGKYIRCNDSYTLTIDGRDELFNLERKKQIARNNIKIYKDFLSIVNIEYVGRYPCKCVTVDSDDNCYLINDFITTHNCAKSYSLSAIMSHNLIIGENSTSKKRIITALLAYQKEFLKDDKDGTLSKFRPSINFIFLNTPWPHLMLKNSPNEMSWLMGYKDEFGRDLGSLNTTMAVSIKDDLSKIRGKRGILLFEEMGSMPGLLEVYDICRKSVEDGGYSFGLMILVGTAAEKESDFSSAKTLLYSPGGYNIYSIKNVFDKPNQGKQDFGFFFPAYINRAGCYNKDGVSDVVKALLEILMARYKAKYSADPKSVLRVIAEDPITPAEAIIKVKNAYFPVNALNERLMLLDSNPKALSDVWVGDLVFNGGGEVEFKPTADEPIRSWKVDNDTPGAVEIFNMPERDRNGKVFSNRYIAGTDPVDNDLADSSSFSSVFIFDLFTDSIVAEFTGRKLYADDNFEIVRKLCLFYNAVCLFESNKKGIYAYFAKMNSIHLLAETPEYLREKLLVKYQAFGSNKYGVNVSAAINNYANDLLRNWLLQPVPIIVKDNEGEHEETISKLYTVRNRALIEELIGFGPEVNTDRISAMAMVMLYRLEKIILYLGNLNEESYNKIDSSYLGNDDYFTRNYTSWLNRNSKFSKIPNQ